MTQSLELIIDGAKVGWYKDRIEKWDKGEKIPPTTVDVAWTRRCNAACDFCYAQLQSSDGDTITKKNAFDFLDDAAEIGVKGISLISDGESTLVPWWAESIEHAAKCGLAIGAGSNGIKLTKPVLELALPHLRYLRFNFSAGEPRRYSQIMGVKPHIFDVVVQNIRDGMEIIRRDNLRCSLNVQLVLDPKDGDQIIPFARLVTQLRPVYAVIKHAADSVNHDLGIDYTKYEALADDLRRAEEIGKEAGVRIAVKWNRLDGKRHYTRCYGSQFMLQVSGNGGVSNCGFHFNERYRKFYLGSICHERFRDIWASDRYDEVMRYLGSEQFNPCERCGPNCWQHNVNQFLFDYKNGKVELPTTPPPEDIEFL